MKKKTKIVIFTDLDGTLIDKDYSFEDTKEIISDLLKKKISLVICSSKTRSEIEYYRKKLLINDPFISENGAAIFIPKGYFKTTYNYSNQTKKYWVIELGHPYKKIIEIFSYLKNKNNLKVVGFGDLNIKQIAKDTGLSLKLARLAKEREYTEPFKFIENSNEEFIKNIQNAGLNYTRGGRYNHLIGNHDKGKAVNILKKLFALEFGDLVTYGVGDNFNDIPMLKVVDFPIMIKENEKLKKIWEEIREKINYSKK